MVTKREIVVVLNNVRSVYNVGSIFRTCDAAQVSKIYLVGVTPTPLDRFGKFRSDFMKVALGAERTVEWDGSTSSPQGTSVRKVLSLIKKLKNDGYEILAVEQDRRSIPYFSYKNTNKTTKTTAGKRNKRALIPRQARDKCALIFGEETKGLPKSVLDKCDKILEIPMRGSTVSQAHHPKNKKASKSGKESLNVSVAAGIVIFGLMYSSG